MTIALMMRRVSLFLLLITSGNAAPVDTTTSLFDYQTQTETNPQPYDPTAQEEHEPATPQHKDQPMQQAQPQPQQQAQPQAQNPSSSQHHQQQQHHQATPQPQQKPETATSQQSNPTELSTPKPQDATTSTTTQSQSQGFHPITNSNIHHAVKEWMKNRNEAMAKFGPIEAWNTSRVSDMSLLFSWERSHALSQFQDNITMWDTHRVINMSHIFFGNAVMNLNLRHWNVSRVVDMSSAFAHTQKFEGHGLRSWNTAKVKSMTRMFRDAQAFNSNGVHLWNVKSLQNATRMFHGASSFRGNHQWKWNTMHLVDMTEMFAETPVFSGDLSELNVSKVTSMKGTFFKAGKFNANLTKWDVHKVTDMNSVFAYATSFDGTGLPKWNVSRVINFSNAFKRSNFNQNVSAWNVKRATDLRNMFRYAAHMKQKVCWTLHKNANVDGIFFQTKAHFDRKCVKKNAIKASCCRPRLDNACECGEHTVNQDHEVEAIGSNGNNNLSSTPVEEEPGAIGSISSVSFFSSGSDHMMAFGIISVVASLLLLVCVIRRFRLRKTVTTIDVGGADDIEISDLDMTAMPYPQTKNNGTLNLPASSTKSFSSSEDDEDGPLEDVAMREII